MKNASQILEDLIKYIGDGATLNSLSKTIGLKRSQNLYDIENGRVQKISSELSEKICAAYPELNRAWLLGKSEKMLLANKPGKEKVINDKTVQGNQTSTGKIKAVYKIIDTNKSIVEQQREVFDSQQKIIENTKASIDNERKALENTERAINLNEKIAERLDKIYEDLKTNVIAEKENRAVDDSIFQALRVFVIQGAAGKTFDSEEEAEARLNKLFADLKKKDNASRIQSG